MSHSMGGRGQNKKSMGKASSSACRLSVAPMMGWTDRHYRYMARLLTKHALLYTEMVVDDTVSNILYEIHFIIDIHIYIN